MENFFIRETDEDRENKCLKKLPTSVSTVTEAEEEERRKMKGLSR
jgi:hypothetical protein